MNSQDNAELLSAARRADQQGGSQNALVRYADGEMT